MKTIEIVATVLILILGSIILMKVMHPTPLKAMTAMTLHPMIDFTQHWTYSANIQILSPLTSGVALAIYQSNANSSWAAGSFSISIDPTTRLVHVGVSNYFDAASTIPLHKSGVNHLKIISSGGTSMTKITFFINKRHAGTITAVMPVSVGSVVLMQNASPNIGISHQRIEGKQYLPVMTTMYLPSIDFTQSWTYSASIQLLEPISGMATLAMYQSVPGQNWSSGSFNITIASNNVVNVGVSSFFGVASTIGLSINSVNQVLITCSVTGSSAKIIIMINNAVGLSTTVTMPPSVGKVPLIQYASPSIGILEQVLMGEIIH